MQEIPSMTVFEKPFSNDNILDDKTRNGSDDDNMPQSWYDIIELMNISYERRFDSKHIFS